MRQMITLVGAFLSVVAMPSIGVSQTAQSCVSSSWAQFQSEIKGIAKPFESKGDDYLVAFGWIQATQACLAVSQYDPALADDVEAFRQAIAVTRNRVETAIRTDTRPQLIGMAAGAGDGGVVYLFPKTAPGNAAPSRPSGNKPQAMTGAVLLNQGGDQVEYRMLSQRQWMQVQARLTRMGHDTGGVDGIVGPKTYAAIRSYQRDKRLRQTGILTGKQLRAFLN